MAKVKVRWIETDVHERIIEIDDAIAGPEWKAAGDYREQIEEAICQLDRKALDACRTGDFDREIESAIVIDRAGKQLVDTTIQAKAWDPEWGDDG